MQALIPNKEKFYDANPELIIGLYCGLMTVLSLSYFVSCKSCLIIIKNTFLVDSTDDTYKEPRNPLLDLDWNFCHLFHPRLHIGWLSLQRFNFRASPTTSFSLSHQANILLDRWGSQIHRYRILL